MPDRPCPGLTTTARLTGASHQGGSDKLDTGVIKTQPKNALKMTSTSITIGTWNVRTLYAQGKVHELTHELKRYRWDVIGLSETRTTGFGETTTDEGHKIWFSGKDKIHEHGVGFIVNKEAMNYVISCTPISERLISIRLSAKPHNMSIIQVYAPTTTHEDEVVEKFYDDLERTILNTPRKDIMIIQGDWNAKVGTDAYKDWAGTAGKFCVGETNDRGLRLLDFARNHNLTLANTLHPHKRTRTVTWHSPNGQIHNQIDFILTPQRFKSSINKAKTRTYPGADIGSDHDLVMMKFKLKLNARRQAKRTRIRFDLDKLKDPQIVEIFQATLGGKFAALNVLDKDVDELSNEIDTALLTSAEEVLGKQRSKKQPWITNEALDLCDKRRELRKVKFMNDTKHAEYQQMNKKVRRKIKEDKEKWIELQCLTIDLGLKYGNSKVAYNTLKTITKSNQPRATIIEDKQGKMISNKEVVLKRWSEYCADLYNIELHPDVSILQEQLPPKSEEESPSILKEEIEASIKSLKPGKSPGIDNIPAELIKAGGDMITEIYLSLCQKIWQHKKWPQKWTQSLVIPLPKKGNLRQCQNYRTISLISHPSKIMLRVILNRLKPQGERLLAEEQAGFRERRSTVEQICSCRILIEKHLQHQKDLFHNFIDFRKAFDRVWHDGLWHILSQYNIENGLIDSMKALYNNASSTVILDNRLGEPFRTSVGVRQGCLLSPILFNLYLERIMSDALQDHHTSISIGGRRVCNLRFADDIDLLAGSNEELQHLTDRLNVSAAAFGMEISTSKSKIMVNTVRGSHAYITINGEALEEVKKFKYLGAVIASDGTSIHEIKSRMATATAAMSKLHPIWRSKISSHIKLKLYKSLVVSILLYGCESWTLTAESENKIQAFETKSFRKILGISYKDHVTNKEVIRQIESLTGPQEPLLATVKRRKLTWFGHAIRHDSLSNTIIQGTIEGCRKRGRQRKRWSDNIKEWTQMSTDDLLRTARDRTAWRRLSVSSALTSPRRRKSRDQ